MGDDTKVSTLKTRSKVMVFTPGRMGASTKVTGTEESNMDWVATRYRRRNTHDMDSGKTESALSGSRTTWWGR